MTENSGRGAGRLSGDENDASPRERESGDVAEPDAPTSAEENEGLSTVLDSEPVTGVQDSADEE